MKTRMLTGATAAALLAFSGAAFAQTAVTATSDLNIRSGPGPQYNVVGVIDVDHKAQLDGCLQDSKWCRVSYNGTDGWAYSDYLVADYSGHETVLAERPADASVPVVQYDEGGGSAGATVGAAGGAVVGALVGGPVGAAVGGIAGAAAGGATGAAINPPSTVRTYVSQNSLDPVYLNGEVVVGAGVPDNVALQPIPDSDYRYVNVNGQPVLVRPSDRRIVYVFR